MVRKFLVNDLSYGQKVLSFKIEHIYDTYYGKIKKFLADC